MFHYRKIPFLYSNQNKVCPIWSEATACTILLGDYGVLFFYASSQFVTFLVVSETLQNGSALFNSDANYL